MLAPKRYKTHVSQILRIQSTITTSVDGLMDHLIAACQHQSRGTRCVSVCRLDLSVPAHLVSPVQRITSLLVELEPLLAAAIGHPSVQRHVTVVSLRRLVNGQLGFLGSDGGRKEGESRRG